jgi:Flp pilus assembly protein TadD
MKENPKSRCMPVLIFLLLFVAYGSIYAQESRTPSKFESLDQELALSEREGNIDRCIEILRSAIKSDPAKPATYVKLGYLLLKKEEAEEALHDFEEALKISPQNHAAKTGKGIALARKGELKSAEAVLREALILNPDPLRTHYELGVLYEKMGEVDGALKEYRSAVDWYSRKRR